nr:Lactonase drp35 [Klebsiella pneumoniae]
MKSPSVLLPGINHMNGLNHNALTCSAVPIPPWERSLQTVEAQPYFNVSQASLVLEGIVFDRNNNLLFVDVATGRVFKLTRAAAFHCP